MTFVIVEQIRRELGDYASVPGDEHRSAVEGQIGALLAGLAARAVRAGWTRREPGKWEPGAPGKDFRSSS